MSATSGVSYPLSRKPCLIFAKFSASFLDGAVSRTSSQPASIMRMDCSIDPSVSIVSVVVILCTRIGAFPPMLVFPTVTSRVTNLVRFMVELQYFICDAYLNVYQLTNTYLLALFNFFYYLMYLFSMSS